MPSWANEDEVEGIAANEAAAAHDPWSADALRGTLARDDAFALVIRQPHVVAHLVGTVTAGEGELLTVAVHPSCRRRGLARRLLDAAYAAWADRGAEVVFLEVRGDNTAARALYGGDGWEEVGLRRRYYADGEDAVVMRRSLATRSAGGA
jgi:ribosomal-protein-alanine N-acetyltransferase